MNRKKTQGIFIAAACLGLAFTFGPVGSLAAQDTDPSSSCIKCHTDLDEMDSYGAASANGSAAIAG